VKVATSVDAFFSNFGDLLAHRRLFRVLCGTGMFWVCGAVSKMNFQPWGINVLKLEKNTQIALLGVWLSIGIMLGALLAGQLHRVGDLSNTRPYGWLFAAFIGVLGLLEVLFGAEFVSGWVPVVVMLILTGVAAGLFLIPLNAALQSECPQDKLGKTIATQNFVDNLAMVAAGGLVFMGARAQLSPSGVFLCLSVFVALVVTVLKVPPKWDAQRDEAEDWP
jgi:LPLT family lysophospholipid transporter-like MFS transporter